MGGVDVAINAAILVLMLVIVAVVLLLWWHGEFEDSYHEIPTQRFVYWPKSEQAIEPGPDEYRDGKFIIRAPKARDVVAAEVTPELATEDEAEAGDLVEIIEPAFDPT